MSGVEVPERLNIGTAAYRWAHQTLYAVGLVAYCRKRGVKHDRG